MGDAMTNGNFDQIEAAKAIGGMRAHVGMMPIAFRPVGNAIMGMIDAVFEARVADAARIAELEAERDRWKRCAEQNAKATDKLAKAVSGLIAILDRNETKGPIPDVEMMFCWLAAQSVRSAVAQKRSKKNE